MDDSQEGKLSECAKARILTAESSYHVPVRLTLRRCLEPPGVSFINTEGSRPGKTLEKESLRGMSLVASPRPPVLRNPPELNRNVFPLVTVIRQTSIHPVASWLGQRLYC